MVNKAKFKFEVLEHMADIKYRVNGSSLDEIFENTVHAISSYLSPDKEVKPVKSKKIDVKGTDEKSLLYNFIEELLFLVDSEHFVPAKAKVKIIGLVLTAEISGDLAKTYTLQQIKAPTYADMEITNKAGYWEAVFVLDV